MNINEYIASGILESYAMGLTTAEESREVERMAAMYSEVQAEIDEIRLALEGYATAFEKQVPAGIKAKVMESITNEGRGAAKGEKVIGIKRGDNIAPARSRFATYAAAAAILLLLASGAINYIFYKQLQQAEENSRSLAATNARMQQELQQQLVQAEEIKNEMQILRDPRNKMIRLNGADISPTSLATVYWNTASKEIYLDVNHLPEPPEGMQYQLWAIVDGKPVDAGMIDMNKPGIHKMKSFASAQAFAVTLEKEGGSPAPNLSAMYVIGNV